MNLLRRVTKNMKLHSKLMISYLLACIIPLLIASFTIYNFSVNSLEDSSREYASIFNSQIVTTIDDFIDQYDKMTKSLLVDNDVISHLGNEEKLSMNERINDQLIIQKLFMRLGTLKPDIKCIMLLGAGDSFYQYGSTSGAVNQVKLKEQDWYKQILQAEDKLVITSIHDKAYYDSNDGIVFTVGRVLLTSGSDFAGVLLIDLDPVSLINLNENFLNARSNYNIKLTVTTNKGGVIYDSDVTSSRKTWGELVKNGYKILENKNSDDFLVLSNKTHKGNLTVNTEIPRSTLLFKIGKINYVTFIAVVLCIIIIFIVSILFSFSITKPIKKLRKSMRYVENGEYYLIEQDTANDEIGGLIMSYNSMIAKIRTLIEDVFIAQIKQKNAKFLALQTQINPHMLYNTLESIRMKALVRGEDEVAVMIKILSRMFKLSLRKDNEKNLIKNELEYAENYIQLQNIRFENHFTLKVNMSEEVKNAGIIALVFQPIIENSIKHGFVDYNTYLTIVIDGDITPEKDILIKVTDNGVGIPKEKIVEINELLSGVESDKFKLDLSNENSEEGIGLKNIAERIRIHYGDNYYLRIATENVIGTVVEIRIPLQ